ncbi:hypothetical protein E2562_007544 [Oryza meyeriana var. granulata]|uniref:MADS-box domain-containing protein n=1 Tax=Oryza meyeriana var. granulata TaxID=110450 RepID=A0A6G1DVB3_9ORYZ|nr:hypothetical protein E2562_007544 [Oryza meyeriana var. granulata]
MPHGGESPVADPREQRRAQLVKLTKKACELSTRCDVSVAMVFPGVGREGQPVYWPSKEEATAISVRYRALPEKNRAKHDVDAEESSESGKVKEDGTAGLLGSWDSKLGDMPGEELRQLLRSIDGSLEASRDRIQKHVDEAEKKLLLEYTNKFMVDSDDDDSDSQDLDRQNAMASNAAPVDMGVKNSLTGEDVLMRDQVQGTQPPDAAATEVELMMKPLQSIKEKRKPLRQSIKEKPKPYTAPPVRGNGVSYDGDGIEYSNLGGYMIERDAFEAVWRDAGPPPCLKPELPDDDGDGELLQLWPFDDGMVVEL